MQLYSFTTLHMHDTAGRAACGRTLAGIAGSNSAGDMAVSCECCVLSGSGLCVGLITRPGESYQERRI